MRKTLQFFSLLMFSAFSVAVLQAQAPAGAPAGATGICKDGTYSTQATKTGACRGHKGVQTWYAATDKGQTTSTAGMPRTVRPQPTPMSAPQAQPAVQPTAAPPNPMPRSSATNSNSSAAPRTSSNGKRLSPEQAASQRPVAPGGGPGMVWANEDTKVYHCNGDAFYGRTKKGTYMTEADAQAKGYHGSHGKTCAGK